MSEKEIARIKYLVIINSLLVIMTGFLHLMFVSPAVKESVALNSLLTTQQEKETEGAKKIAEFKKEKDGFRDDLAFMARAFSSNFTTRSVELIQNGFNQAASGTGENYIFEADFETRKIALAETLGVRMSLRAVRPSVFFGLVKKIRGSFYTVSENIAAGSLDTFETSIEYDFYIPSNNLKIGSFQAAR